MDLLTFDPPPRSLQCVCLPCRNPQLSDHAAVQGGGWQEEELVFSAEGETDRSSKGVCSRWCTTDVEVVCWTGRYHVRRQTRGPSAVLALQSIPPGLHCTALGVNSSATKSRIYNAVATLHFATPILRETTLFKRRSARRLLPQFFADCDEVVTATSPEILGLTQVGLLFNAIVHIYKITPRGKFLWIGNLFLFYFFVYNVDPYLDRVFVLQRLYTAIILWNTRCILIAEFPEYWQLSSYDGIAYSLMASNDTKYTLQAIHLIHLHVSQ